MSKRTENFDRLKQKHLQELTAKTPLIKHDVVKIADLFKSILPANNIITDQLNNITNRVANFEPRVETLETKVYDLEITTNNTDQTLVIHNNTLSELNNDVDFLFNETSIISANIDINDAQVKENTNFIQKLLNYNFSNQTNFFQTPIKNFGRECVIDINAPIYSFTYNPEEDIYEGCDCPDGYKIYKYEATGDTLGCFSLSVQTPYVDLSNSQEIRLIGNEFYSFSTI